MRTAAPLRSTLVGALMVMLGAALPASGAAEAEKILAPGDAAPSFTFSDGATGVVMSSDSVARGKPLLLVFLQTACRSCYSEMLTLKKLHEGMGGFEVLGVFLDMKPKNFKSYMEENSLPFQFTWDANYSIAQDYGVSFTPASFLLDGERKVVAAYRGFHPGTERTMKSDVEKLVGGK